jgi:plastocyanin
MAGMDKGSHRARVSTRFPLLATMGVMLIMAALVLAYASRARAAGPVVRTAGSAATDVSILGSSLVDFRFSPTVVTVTTGSEVHWTNNTAAPHTVTSDLGDTDPWDSGVVSTEYTRTFNVLGTHNYHCSIHPGMVGSVVVLGHVYLPLALRLA